MTKTKLAVFLAAGAAVVIAAGILLALPSDLTGELLGPIFLPRGDFGFPVQHCRCGGRDYEGAVGGAAPEMEVRTHGQKTYFGWKASAGVIAFDAEPAKNPLTPISRAEWDASSPVSAPGQVLANNPETAVVFDGRTFHPAGSRWLENSTKAVASPTRNKLATATVGGPVRPGGLYFFNLWQSWWDLHVEVFGAANGGRLLDAVGRRIRSHRPPSGVRMVWAGKRQLLVSGISSRFSVLSCRFFDPWSIHELPPGGIDLPEDSTEAEGFQVTGEPIHFDDSGRLDSLRLIARLVVHSPGRYNFTAALSREGMRSNSARKQVTRQLSPGRQEMEILWDTEDFQAARGSGAFIVDSLAINTPDGAGHFFGEESISLADLPAPDTTAFNLTGEYGSGTTGISGQAFVLQRTLGYTSPGGVCSWSGLVVQDNREVGAFRGSRRTQAGRQEITYEAGGAALAEPLQRHPLEMRLATLTCNGRELHPHDDGRYLFVF
ncbi:MAG TPA: hypothetical protein VKU19_35470 [Bryobacteraceae bacterium]|nr:hypothetical protein [Bryobacteraceae bacterium]